jgi:uncharacterized sporulation protein YeaH/YhbH (DUF444 family)
MPRRIEEDHKDFRDVVSGRIRKALRKHIKTGKMFRTRGKNGKVIIQIPEIDIPHIVYGDNGEGIKRGPGEPGDVIGQDPQDGAGGDKAGQGEAEGIKISLDLDEVLKFLQQELELPNLKPKENETFEEIKIKYNNISLMGPESLRHNRRTWVQALKRQCAEGTQDDLHQIPGCPIPMRLITPIPRDRRYRQYREIKIPSSNALIIYARDGSASMNAEKCEIASDMAWWIDVWIRRFYKRVDRMFIWHDWTAREVDEDTYYKLRFGGGTACSSAFKFASKQFENRYPPEKWNIYLFYFTDGDNWGEDMEDLMATLENDFGPNVVNFIGVTQILCTEYAGSVKHSIDEAISSGRLKDNIRTTMIGTKDNSGGFFSRGPAMTDEEREAQTLEAIKELLGNKKTKSEGVA